jgi:hypothetical protein
MVAEEYNDPAGVYKVQTFGTLQESRRATKFMWYAVNWGSA